MSWSPTHPFYVGALILLGLTMLILPSCSKAPTPISKKRLTLISNAQAVAVGERFYLNITLDNASQTGLTPTWQWESHAPHNQPMLKLARGGKSGDFDASFIALAEGLVTILVTSVDDASLQDKVVLQINPASVDELRLEGHEELIIGQASTILAFIKATGEINKGVTWQLDPPEMFSVIREEDQEIRLLATRVGTARIVATSKHDPTQQASFEISIRNEPFEMGNAEIDGLVTSSEGDVLPQASEVTVLSGASVSDISTDDDGKYHFKQVPARGALAIVSVKGQDLADMHYTAPPRIMRIFPKGHYTADFTLYPSSPLQRAQASASPAATPAFSRAPRVRDGETYTWSIDKTLQGSGASSSLLLTDVPASITGGAAQMVMPAALPTQLLPDHQTLLRPLNALALTLKGDLTKAYKVRYVLPLTSYALLNGTRIDNGRIWVPVYHFDPNKGGWQHLPAAGWLEDSHGILPSTALASLVAGTYPEQVYISFSTEQQGWFIAARPKVSGCYQGRLVSAANDPIAYTLIQLHPVQQGKVGQKYISISTDHAGYFTIAPVLLSDQSLLGSPPPSHYRLVYKTSEETVLFDNGGQGYPAPAIPSTQGCAQLGELNVTKMITQGNVERAPSVQRYVLTVTDQQNTALTHEISSQLATTKETFTYVSLYDPRLDSSDIAQLCQENACVTQATTNDQGKVILNVPSYPDSNLTLTVQHTGYTLSRARIQRQSGLLHALHPRYRTQATLSVPVQTTLFHSPSQGRMMLYPEHRPAEVYLHLYNRSNHPVTVSSTAVSETWLELQGPSHYQLPSNQQYTLAFSVAGMPKGVYTSTVTLTTSEGELQLPMHLYAGICPSTMLGSLQHYTLPIRPPLANDTTPPSLTITSNTFLPHSTQTLTGTIADESDIAKIQLYNLPTLIASSDPEEVKLLELAPLTISPNPTNAAQHLWQTDITTTTAPQCLAVIAHDSAGNERIITTQLTP